MIKSAILILVLFICIAFQNCRPVSFYSSDSLFTETKVSFINLNNGEGYGGKLSGSYYRFRPDFKCEGNEGPVAHIQANGSFITITESHELACLSDQRNLDLSEIETSVFQKDIVGYKEGIFEALASTPASIPANLVEVWCRDRKDEQGIETITYFDRVALEAVTKIYYATVNSSGVQLQSQGEFSVSRVISTDRVTIGDGKDFELIVFRDQPSPEPGQLKASLKALINGSSVMRETNCRLSGSLDPSLWPAKQIIDLNISSLKLTENQSTMAFAAAVSQGGLDRLFVSSPKGSNQLQVSPPMSGLGVQNFEFSPQSDSLLFWGDVFVPNIMQLVKINLDGSNLTQLNDTLIDGTQAQETIIKFSSDGKNVLYTDGAQELGSPGADIEMFLRSAPLNGGPPTLVNVMTKEVDVFINDFAVSKINKTVAYVFGFSYEISLYLTDISGTSPKKFYRSDIPLNWRVHRNKPIAVPDPGHYFIVKYSNPRTFNEFSYYAINTIDLTSIKFPSTWEYSQLSPNGQHAILRTPDYPKTPTRQAKIFTLTSSNQYDLEDINNPIFSSDSLSILDKQKNAMGEFKLKQFTIENHTESEVCPEALGHLETFKENTESKSILLLVKSRQSVLEFWERTALGQCFKRNSLPVGQHTIEQIEFSPDQKSALVKTQRNIANLPHQELFFIPFDGHPPYQIDSALHQQVKISQVHFLKDSNDILFVADSIRKNVENAFLWRMPLP